MNLAEKIKAAEKNLIEYKDQLDAATKKLEAEDCDSVAVMAEIDELSERIEREAAGLESLKRAEAALARSARPVGESLTTGGPGNNGPGEGEDDPDTDPDKDKANKGARRLPLAGTRAAPGQVRRTLSNPADYIIRAAIIAGEAHLKAKSPYEILRERYNDDANTKAVMEMVVKAAQNPAMTNVAGWAQELTRQGYEAFMEWLAPESVIPRLPLQRFTFDGYASLVVPMRKPNPTLTNPNLAAGWRKEGDPIRVGAITLQSATLRPYSCGVIGTFTMELLRRSTPSIEAVIRQAMLEDTAIMLDTKFLSADAVVTDKSPAGITNAIGAGNTAVSTGATPAAITADLKARLASMYGQGLGRRPVWVMNPANAIALSMMLTATGALQFPELANGQLVGVPVVTSITVAADTVYLIDAAEIAFAGGAPEFEGSTQATIHEEDTTPLPIVDNAGTPVVAHPVRSLFQTYSGALRSVWSVDWLRLRDGAVQTITGVAW
jgi:hypothetical protein